MEPCSSTHLVFHLHQQWGMQRKEKTELFQQLRMSSFSLKKCGRPLLAISGSGTIRITHTSSNFVSSCLVSSVSLYLRRLESEIQLYLHASPGPAPGINSSLSSKHLNNISLTSYWEAAVINGIQWLSIRHSTSPIQPGFFSCFLPHDSPYQSGFCPYFSTAYVFP